MYVFFGLSFVFVSMNTTNKRQTINLSNNAEQNIKIEQNNTNKWKTTLKRKKRRKKWRQQQYDNSDDDDSTTAKLRA